MLVVLALARPTLPGGSSTAAGTEAASAKTHHVFVLDASYSMAYRPIDKSRFDRAREIIGRMVQDSPEGDAFSLVLMSSQPRIVVGTPAFRRDDFLREVERLELPHGGADLPRAMTLVEEVLALAKHEAHRLDRCRVYFFTDLQRATWDLDRLDPATRGALADRVERLMPSTVAALVDLGQRDAENVAVTALRCDESLVTPGQTVEIRAELKNFGRQPRDRQPVELLVDGNRVGRQEVTLPPGGEAGVSFSCRFETAGDHAVEARTENDPLDVDNHRYLVVPVKQEVRVLCVEGRPSGAVLGGVSPSGYLATALAPQGSGSGRALIRPEVVAEIALLESSLAEYDCVILSNVAQFTPGEAKALDAYLRGGGSLIFFLGDRVRPEAYNEQLWGGNPSGLRVLPARIGPLVAQPESRLDPLDYQHPIVRPFRGREKAGLLSTPVFRHFQLLLPEGSLARKVLALPGGDPLVVEEAVHRGRVIVVATLADATWDGQWTPLPLWPSFLPLVHEMLAYAVGAQAQRRGVLVGESLGGALGRSAVRAAAAGTGFSIRRPGGRRDEGQIHADADQSTWSFTDTTQSGFYTAEFGPPGTRSETFAVNVDTVESDLDTVSIDEVPRRLWPAMAVVAQDDWRRLGEEPAGETDRPVELARGLIYAALLLLAAETYLARRFGHHSP